MKAINFNLKNLIIFDKAVLAKIAIVAALLAYIYYPTFVWMVDRWMTRDSYYGHGFLIPLVSLYWIFQKLEKIKQQSHSGEKAGLILLAAGIALQVFGFYLHFYFISAFSFVLVLLGLAHYLLGKKAFGSIWFPIAFLFLMIPLPLLVIAQVTLKMKFFVSAIATGLVNAMNVHAVQQGSYIYTPNAVLVVGDPCSGLRSFLAFLTLGFVFAYDEKLNFWKKAVLVVSGLPLAIASNVLRVTFLTLCGEIYGMEYTGPGAWPHDISGFAVFLIAFLAFMAIRHKLELIHAKK